MGDVYSGVLARLACMHPIALALFMTSCSPETLEWLRQVAGEWPHHPPATDCNADAGDVGCGCPAGAVQSGEDGACAWGYSQLVASANHNCAVREQTGAVACWGQASGAAGWPRDVAFSQIATAYALSCGLRRDTGAIVCWGGVTPNGLPTTGRYTRISVGSSHALTDYGPHVCAIREADGAVECWGDDRSGQVSGVPRGVAFSDVAAGNGQTCGIRSDDQRVVCWGGVLLDPPPGAFCSLARGGFAINMCGLTCEGQAVCWGIAEFGVPPPADVKFRQISLGLFDACGIRAADGGIECWAGGLTPDVQGVAFEQLAVGGDWYAVNGNDEDSYQHLCALRADDHRVQCWGSDVAGQVSGAPSLTRFSKLASQEWLLNSRGSTESALCALREDDQRAQCWGANFSQTLKRDVAYSEITARCGLRLDDGLAQCGDEVASSEPLIELDQVQAACGLRRSDDTPLCWNGTESGIVTEAPQALALHGLTVGPAHACALRKSDDRAVCWGDDTAVASTPVDIPFRRLQATQFSALDASVRTCGIRMQDDLVQCWGRAAYFDATPPSDAPMLQLSSDNRCGILADTHEIACWPEATRQVDPSQRGVRFRDIVNTHQFTCGIREADSLLTCWGDVLWNPI